MPKKIDLTFGEILNEYLSSNVSAKALAKKYAISHPTFLDKINAESVMRFGKSACKARSEQKRSAKVQAHAKIHQVTISKEVPKEELWKIRLVTDYLKGYTSKKMAEAYRITRDEIPEIVKEVEEKYGLNDNYTPPIGGHNPLSWYNMKFFDDWGNPVQPSRVDDEEESAADPTHLIVAECKLNRVSVSIDEEVLKGYKKVGAVSFKSEQFEVFVREMDSQVILVKKLTK